MVEPLLHDIEQPPINPGPVWALRVASIGFLFLSLALMVVFLLDGEPPLPYLTGVFSLVLYPAVLWGLRTTRPKRLSLGLAVALGSLWFVLSAFYAFQFTASRFRHEPAPPSSTDILLLLAGSSWVLALLQGAYAGIAWRLRRSISGGRAGLLKLLGASVGGLAWGGLVILAIGFEYSNQPGQSPAVGALRTLNTAEITYYNTFGDTYTSNLAELAPPARGRQPSVAAAGLIDFALASGTKRYRSYLVGDDIVDEIDSALGRKPDHAYRYEYRPGPREAHGRIVSYTICARPIGRVVNQNSYFTDETGVIRTTTEDRCPTAKDFPVAG